MRGYRTSDTIGETWETCGSPHPDEYGRGRRHRLGLSRNEVLQWIVKPDRSLCEMAFLIGNVGWNGTTGTSAPLLDVAPRAGMTGWTRVPSTAALVTTAASVEDEAQRNFG